MSMSFLFQLLLSSSLFAHNLHPEHIKLNSQIFERRFTPPYPKEGPPALTITTTGTLHTTLTHKKLPKIPYTLHKLNDTKFLITLNKQKRETHSAPALFYSMSVPPSRRRVAARSPLTLLSSSSPAGVISITRFSAAVSLPSSSSCHDMRGIALRQTHTCMFLQLTHLSLTRMHPRTGLGCGTKEWTMCESLSSTSPSTPAASCVP